MVKNAISRITEGAYVTILTGNEQHIFSAGQTDYDTASKGPHIE